MAVISSTLKLFVSLTLLLGLTAPIRAPLAEAIAEPAARMQFDLNADLLQAWSVAVDPSPAALSRSGYWPIESALVSRKSGAGVHWRIASRLALHGTVCDCELVLSGLVALSDKHWQLRDADGLPMLQARLPHMHRRADGGLRLQHFDLVVTAELAARLRQPKLQDQVIGRLALDLPAPGSAIEAMLGQRDCRPDLDFPEPGEHTDVALLDISAVQALRCARPADASGLRPPCDEAHTDGKVVIAPSAELANVGTNDVPWFVKFFPAAPPYGNDQHPFLIWNAYRIDSDGRLFPLGESPLKHAFFSQNNDCDCVGDYILYKGCSDVYGVGTNDIDDALSMRHEIAPAVRIWGRCGSIYDADCDGAADPGGQLGDRVDDRLAVAETELQVVGARYWMEAWYLARDDDNLDNSLGRVEFSAEKTAGAWSVARVGAFSQGSLVSLWHSQPGAVQTRMHRITTATGELDLAVRVVLEPDGRYRYDYVLMNYDHALAQIDGLPPDQRVLGTRGPQRLEVTLPGASMPQGAELAQSPQAGAGWLLEALPGLLRASAPVKTHAGWGRLIRLSMHSDLGPGEGMAQLVLSDDELTVSVPVPLREGLLFVDGFE